MIYIKYIFSLAFILGNIVSIFAQNGISSTLFLSSASQQQNVQIANQQVEFQSEQDAELPWLQELEFRTETNEFKWKQQEYAVRVTPNTKRQRNAQKNYHQALNNLSKTEQELILKNALFNRYEWLVDWLKVEQELANKRVLKTVYNDKLTVLKHNVGNLNFKVNDLVKAEEELLEIDADMLKLNIKKQYLLSAFQYLTNRNDTLELDKKRLITTTDILKKMRLQSLDTLNSLALERRKNRIEILDKETEIELSEIHNPISYVQLKGGGGNNVTFREFVSIGVGIKFPLKGDKKLDLNELALEKLEESGEYLILKSKLERKQKELIEQLEQLIIQQQYLEKQLKNSQAVFVLNKLLEIEDSNPLDILDLKEIIIKKEQKIEAIDLQILKIYVDWLAVSNTMMQQPLQNHLTNQLDILPMN